jgi:hypothetical protein
MILLDKLSRADNFIHEIESTEAKLPNVLLRR